MEPISENLLRRATLGDLITRSALKYGDRTVLMSGDRKVSFWELNEQSCRAANAFLDLGIGRGDRVAFITHNCLNYIYCRLGLTKIGAVPVPINFMLKGEEIAYIINDAEPKFFLVEDVLAKAVLEIKDKIPGVERFGWFGFGKDLAKPEEWVDVSTFFDERYPAIEPEVIVETNDLASIMYTTGTESFPKGVMTTHFNYIMAMFHLVCDCDFRRDDVLIIDIPLFHIAGTSVLSAVITVGAKAIIEYAPDPINTLRKTQEEKITYWIYPPTLFAALPMVPGFGSYDLSSLKKCVSFGAVMPQVVLERWKAIKPDLQWRNYWGQTESSPVGTTSSPEYFERKLTSIGRPDTNVTVKVVDEHDKEVPAGQTGELVMRGPAVMLGYWKKPEVTASTLAGGWLHTGDVGYMDEEGYFYFTDRKKDMIKSGGENVSSQEVEGLLLRHPKVALAAVIGLPDPYWMEAVNAFVVLRPLQSATEEEIISFCKEHLAKFKVPKKVHFLPSLPTSATGKILKRKIKEEVMKN